MVSSNEYQVYSKEKREKRENRVSRIALGERKEKITYVIS